MSPSSHSRGGLVPLPCYRIGANGAACASRSRPLAELEEGEERDRLLVTCEPADLLVEVEAPARRAAPESARGRGRPAGSGAPLAERPAAAPPRARAAHRERCGSCGAITARPRCERRRPEPEVPVVLGRQALGQPAAASLSRRYSSSRRASSSAASSGSSSSRSTSSPGKSARAFSSSSADEHEELTARLEVQLVARSQLLDEGPTRRRPRRRRQARTSSLRTSVSSRSKGPRTRRGPAPGPGPHGGGGGGGGGWRLGAVRMRDYGGPGRAAGIGPLWSGGLDRARSPGFFGALADQLPPDEERDRKDEQHDRHLGVQPLPEELVRRIDPQHLLVRAAARVVRDVEREQPRRLDPEARADPDQGPDSEQVPEHLVEEARMEGGVERVLRGTVLRIDLEGPGQVGRLTEEPWLK